MAYSAVLRQPSTSQLAENPAAAAQPRKVRQSGPGDCRSARGARLNDQDRFRTSLTGEAEKKAEAAAAIRAQRTSAIYSIIVSVITVIAVAIVAYYLFKYFNFNVFNPINQTNP